MSIDTLSTFMGAFEDVEVAVLSPTLRGVCCSAESLLMRIVGRLLV